LNSVARSPARTVQRYGNSGPAAGRRFKRASISALNRNSVGLRLVPRDFSWHPYFENPFAVVAAEQRFAGAFVMRHQAGLRREWLLPKN